MLGVPLLSCWFALQVPVPLSLTSSTLCCPVLLPLLWVRAYLQSHLTLCGGTQPLGDFCKVESPFCLCRPPHLSHLLSAISWGGWLISPVSPPSSAPSAPSCLLSPRPRAAMPQAPLGAPSWASAVCTGGPWPLTPFGDPCPQPWAACNAHLPGPLLTHLAGGPPGLFSRPGLHTLAWVCFYSHPPR